MASAGSGSPPRVAGELFKMMTGINMLHVPYTGDSPAIADLIGDQVQVYFGTAGGSIELRCFDLKRTSHERPERPVCVRYCASKRHFRARQKTDSRGGIGHRGKAAGAGAKVLRH